MVGRTGPRPPASGPSIDGGPPAANTRVPTTRSGVTRSPLWANDFDDRYHQSAPADQRAAGFLRGGELVELTNLTPDGVLRFSLPKVHVGFTTFFGRRNNIMSATSMR